MNDQTPSWAALKMDRPVQVDAPSPDDLYREMRAAGSDEMDFHVHRDPEPGLTFSAEALDDLVVAFRTFVTARLSARFDGLAEGDPGPSDLHLAVKLTLDGTTFTIPEDLRPWYALDGAHRDNGVAAAGQGGKR